MAEKYNGWTNYESWAVALWMGNEQSSSNYWESCAQECWEAAEASQSFTKDEQATLDLASRMKDEFEDAKDDLLENAKQTASIWADLLGAALSEVNWHEIAQHYIADVDKATEEEAEEV